MTLDQIRNEIAKTKQAIHQVGRQPLNAKDTAESIEKTINHLTSLYDKTNLGLMVANGYPLTAADFLNAATGVPPEEKFVCTLAAMFPDQLRTMLTTESAGFVDKKAPSRESRGDQIMALQQQLYRLEREEEAEVVRLEELGHPVTRRMDADMAAVLLIEDENDD